MNSLGREGPREGLVTYLCSLSQKPSVFLAGWLGRPQRLKYNKPRLGLGDQAFRAAGQEGGAP